MSLALMHLILASSQITWPDVAMAAIACTAFLGMLYIMGKYS